MAVAHLTATTIELETSKPFELLTHLPKNPMVYVREGDGLVGWGEALRLESNLSSKRIPDLANQWRAVVANSLVSDQVNLPGTGLVAFGALAFSDASETSSVLVVPRVILGSMDGRTWLTTISNLDSTGANPDEQPSEDFWSNVGEYSKNDPVSFQAGSVSTERFKSLVTEAVEMIKTGNLAKVVIARDLVAAVENSFDVRAVLQKLSQQYPTCWVYAVDGMFGASPELLVRVAHSQVSARVLAGTAGRGTDPGVDQAIAVALAASSKNTAEHAFAVNSLVKSLAPFCSKVDADPVPFSLALPNVWHLASDVHGVLREEASVLDVAAALHPTAAVAGTPTALAQEVIAKLENNDRGRYAGPVGWIGADGDGEWAIALRGAQLSDNPDESIGGLILHAFAGCGIVGESDAEAELAETELKFRPIREAL